MCVCVHVCVHVCVRDCWSSDVFVVLCALVWVRVDGCFVCGSVGVCGWVFCVRVCGCVWMGVLCAVVWVRVDGCFVCASVGACGWMFCVR